MEIDYRSFMMIAYAISSIVACVMYVSKIKNELNTRVAVLEAGATAINEDLKEIKTDVKELLRTVTAS